MNVNSATMIRMRFNSDSDDITFVIKISAARVFREIVTPKVSLEGSLKCEINAGQYPTYYPTIEITQRFDTAHMQSVFTTACDVAIVIHGVWLTIPLLSVISSINHQSKIIK